ncbi:MAG: Fur family transcriptional regulator [Alphaproteobacteria bacterium]
MDHSDKLRDAGLRLTQQRLTLASMLFDNGDRHFTAEILHEEMLKSGKHISLATIYNSLHYFAKHGLIREINIDSERSWFDTNTHNHFHYYDDNKMEVMDVPDTDAEQIREMIHVPEGYAVKDLNVVVYLQSE